MRLRGEKGWVGNLRVEIERRRNRVDKRVKKRCSGRRREHGGASEGS